MHNRDDSPPVCATMRAGTGSLASRGLDRAFSRETACRRTVARLAGYPIVNGAVVPERPAS